MRPTPIGRRFLKVIFSIFLVICGIVEFRFSFDIMAWNETQFRLAEQVRQSIDITTLPNPRDLEGKLVSITDRITTDSLLGDGQFLKAAPYIAIEQRVEYYQQDERDREANSPPQNDRSSTPRSSQPSSRNDRNSSTPRSSPSSNRNERNSSTPRSSQPSSRNERSSNPQPDRQETGKWSGEGLERPLSTVAVARIGRYRLEMSQFRSLSHRRDSCISNSKSFKVAIPVENRAITLPVRDNLRLTTENTQIPPHPVVRSHWQSYTQVLPQYIFQGAGSSGSPAFGDMRVCYAVLPNNAIVTIFGRIEGDRLVAYPDGDRQILRLLPGSRAVAIDLLQHQLQSLQWFGRLMGFLLTWTGLSLICSPSFFFPGKLPWLGRMNRNAFIYCFWPAVGISVISAVTTYFSHSVIPAMTITIAILLYLAYRNWRLR